MEVMAKLDAMDAEHKKDRKEIKSLTAEVTSLRKENDRLRGEMSALKQENSALKENAEKLGRENALLRDDNEHLKKIRITIVPIHPILHPKTRTGCQKRSTHTAAESQPGKSPMHS